MTKQDRDEVRKLIQRNRPGHEHFPGCWNDNGWCAAFWCVEALEQLLDSQQS